MSWRDNLRPASFRGVAFEAVSHGARRGRRGVHHQYPLLDQGWVEDLGARDQALTLEGYVIGDDYAAQRDALSVALDAPGAGTLIHPWLGEIEVVVDPNAGWSFSESARRGRHARFSMTFLRAPDALERPTEQIDDAAAVDEAAEEVEDGALDVFGARIDLSGVEAVLDDVEAGIDTFFKAFDGVRALISGVQRVASRVVGLVAGVVSEAQGLVRDVLAVRDIFATLGGIGDIFGAVFGDGAGGGRATGAISSPGDRPAAVPVRLTRGDDAAARVVAARALLAAIREPAATPASGARIAANRAAMTGYLEALALAALARAVRASSYDGHEAALGAVRAFDADVEIALRREGDLAAPSDALLARLTDLRRAVREALFRQAAGLAPITRRDLGESLPALAAAWRLDGPAGDAADLIARNGVIHPLWAPPEILTRGTV